MLKEKILKSKKGSGLIIAFSFIAIFLVFVSIILLDFSTFYNQNIKVKAIINRSVKGATLQVDTNAVNGLGQNLSAQGIFVVDEVKSENVFKSILSTNLGLNPATLEPLSNSILKKTPEILEFEVLNNYVDMPYEYYSPTLKQNYLVEYPSVFVVLKFQVKSYYIGKEFTFGKLSSAQLLNVAN